MKTKPKKSEYDINAEKLLEKFGVLFSAVRAVPNECPKYCTDKKHIHGAKYWIEFKRTDNTDKSRFNFFYWNSHNDENAKPYPKRPTPYDVLACIEKYEPGTFADFCDNFGYDSDSIRALETYNAVVKEYRDFSAFFSPSEITELQEIE